MFRQSKVVYIIKESEGNPEKIIIDLKNNNIFDYYFRTNIDLENKYFYKFIASLPKNTVFCIDKIFSDDSISEKKTANIALPFISSHINFPVKTGETVWFYQYDINNEKLPVKESYVIDGYYLGRVHSLANTEDTSYCFSERENTVFHVNNNDIFDKFQNSKFKNAGILEALEANNLYLNDQLDDNILFKSDTKVISKPADRILNTDYFRKELKKYKFDTGVKNQLNSEDFVLSGTYNASIRLTSEGGSQEDLNNEILFETKKGKIQLFTGENKKTKNKSFLNSSLVKTIDEEGFINHEGVILNSYLNNISPEFYNGVFLETVKSERHFFNEIKTSEYILDSIKNKEEENFINNSSSLILSESDREFNFIKNTIKNNVLPQLGFLFTKKENISNIASSERFVTYHPSIFESYSPSFTQEEEIQSNITAIADNVSISIHDNISGEIIISTPSSQDKKSNYIKLDNTGNFQINSQKIVIGDANRVLKDNKNGFDAGLYLGFSKDMQSLVLGEQLKVFIEEMISVQKQSIDLIKDLFKHSKEVDKNCKEAIEMIQTTLSEVGLQIENISKGPVPLPALSPVSALLKLKIDGPAPPNGDTLKTKIAKIKIKEFNEKINSFKASSGNQESGESEALYRRLTIIENNLDKILSKFTKTS